MRKRVMGWSSVPVLMSVLLLAAEAFANGIGGPPLGATGAPGETTCVQCHVGTPLNGGGGEITIEGPLEYAPGETYELEVRIVDASASNWGFELTVLDEETDSAAGSLGVVATETDVSLSGGREYLHHTVPGSGGQTFAWLFEWTAPEQDVGDVVFHAAGNAGNGSGMFGDHIYAGSTRVVSAPEPTAGAVGLAALLTLAWIRRRDA